MTELEQLKQQAQEISQRIEVLEKAKGMWIPEVGEYYWCQESSGGIKEHCFDNDSVDIGILRTQRVYSSQEIAKANDCRKETIAVWNKFREMETEAVDWANNKQNKFVLSYCHEEGVFKFHGLVKTQHYPEPEWYTTSAAACVYVIANMQTELKKIWRVS